MGIQVNVHGPRGEEKIIDLCDNIEQMKNITVEQLKRKIRNDLRISTSHFIFTETLEESTLVMAYGIRHLSTIHTLILLPGGN
uniref:Ubiquitin-like domain-containing protein n=1 Tax=Labrus bergylta TaxID=56723 RepID=A0A3Q3G2X3_9LABR